VKSDINGKVIYNIYDHTGALMEVYDTSTLTRTDYVRADGVSVARVSNGVTTYLHQDTLGSAATGTDSNGNVAWTEHYTPFGETTLNPPANDNLDGFTGHIRDKATGLNYMQARYYDPALGRFLSIDPVGFSPDKPFMFGRYTYVGNDPVNGVDPFGLAEDDDLSCGSRIPGNIAGSCFSIVEFGQKPRNSGLRIYTENRSASPRFKNPTGGGKRGCDVFGCGGFGQSRDQGTRKHEGQDYLGYVGQEVLATQSGTVTKIGYPYGDNLAFRYIEITQEQKDLFSPEVDITVVREFYVLPLPTISVGTYIRVGRAVGVMQNLNGRYPGISNHVHLEMRRNGVLLDPSKYVP